MTALETLDLNLLFTFEVFVEEGTVHATARRLGRSQPAISSRLQHLRDALGADLVTRVGRKLALTPAGRLVYDRAAQIRGQAQALIDEVRSADEAGVLKVGVLPTVGTFLAAPAIAQIRARHPGVKIELEPALVPPLLGLLARAEIDLVVGVGAPPVGASVEVLCPVTPVLAMQRARARRGRAAMVRHAMKEANWVTYGRVDDDFFAGVEAFLARHGIARRVVVRVSNIATVKRLVCEGVGVAIVPDYTVDEATLVTAPVPGLRLQQSVWIARRTSSPPMQIVQHFVAALREQVAR